LKAEGDAMQLIILETTADAVRAGYKCPCGCSPSVTYQRAGTAVHDGCCCGNEFAVGLYADTSLPTKPGYHAAATSFQAPWGESVTAAWLIGPSVHAQESQHVRDRDEAHESHRQDGMTEAATSGTSVDPVCGMTVAIESAINKELKTSYSDREFYFCGRGCKLDFEEDPERYLDASYVASM
jgi:YHS domain-containing protein